MAGEQIEKTQEANPDNSMPLIRINGTTIAVKKIAKVLLNVDQTNVAIYLDHRPEPFVFTEDSSEKATSLFIALGQLLEKTQNIVPFLFFANHAVRFDLLNYVHIEGLDIFISTGEHAPEQFKFESIEKAQENFNDLMVRLGISQPKSQTEQPPINKGELNPPNPVKPARKKHPDKIPRKTSRA